MSLTPGTAPATTPAAARREADPPRAPIHPNRWQRPTARPAITPTAQLAVLAQISHAARLRRLRSTAYLQGPDYQTAKGRHQRELRGMRSTRPLSPSGSPTACITAIAGHCGE